VYYTVISLWASLNGSILFWAGVLGVYVTWFTWSHRDQHREYMPYTLGVLLVICVFFSILVATIANPFAAVFPVPLDGPGPNPLLQNHWLMAFHPPTLYLGYVGMVVPYAMACGALLAGRLDAGWMAPLRRWTLLAWSFLTVAIMLGGWWSYEVLGWGGYWAWDPVENASFLPWLTCTAFLHAAMVMQRRGTQKRWSLVLIMATFLLTLLGTFMTRSGVFNSVHSFTQSDIGPTFLYFIAIVLTFSVLLLAFQDSVLDDNDELTVKPTRALSREFAILLQNLVFSVFTFTVLLGTLYPLIAEALDGTRVSVGEPFFNRMALPLCISILFLMGVGAALPWGRISSKALVRTFVPPVSLGLGAAAILFALGYDDWYFLFAIGISIFALWLNGSEFVKPVLARMKSADESVFKAIPAAFIRAPRLYGATLSHVGVAVTAIAIAFSSAYKVERDVTIQIGEQIEFAGYTATFMGSEFIKEPQRDSLVASIALSYDGKSLPSAHPSLNYYRTMREPVGTPDVHVRPQGDIYFSLLHAEPDGSYVSMRVMYSPFVVWVWIGPILMALGGLIAGSAATIRRRRRAGRVNMGVLVVGFTLVATLVLLLSSGFGKDPKSVPSMLEGKMAPSFSLVDTHGDAFNLADHRGEVVVINFWSSWCQPCKIEHGLLLRAPDVFKDVTFVGVIYSDKTDNAVRYLKKSGETYRHLEDPKGHVAIDYGVAGVPETFFVDANGVISYKQIGPLTGASLTAAIGKAKRGLL
jgi:cytochrome c-type biogenesis protein CcmF